MSIINVDTLDALGLDDEGNLLMLLIDADNWKNQKEHLFLLQEKINHYVQFIETKQYIHNFPAINFKKFIIRITFLNKIPKKCINFLEEVNNQLNMYEIFVIYEVENG